MPLEQVQVAVDGIGQPETLHEQVAGAQATAVQAACLVADFVVDIAVAKQTATLFGLLLLAQAPLDAALAIPQAAAYGGLHLKYLHAWGKGKRCHTPIPPQMPRYFKSFHAPKPPSGGGLASSGARSAG
jgi:hypothetical protein